MRVSINSFVHRTHAISFSINVSTPFVSPRHEFDFNSLRFDPVKISFVTLIEFRNPLFVSFFFFFFSIEVVSIEMKIKNEEKWIIKKGEETIGRYL